MEKVLKAFFSMRCSMRCILAAFLLLLAGPNASATNSAIVKTPEECRDLCTRTGGSGGRCVKFGWGAKKALAPYVAILKTMTSGETTSIGNGCALQVVKKAEDISVAGDVCSVIHRGVDLVLETNFSGKSVGVIDRSSAIPTLHFTQSSPFFQVRTSRADLNGNVEFISMQADSEDGDKVIWFNGKMCFSGDIDIP